MADSQLFLEEFNIKNVDAKKYDRVSRISGESLDGATTMHLDINHEMYPVAQSENVQMLLASTLNLDGTKDMAADKGWRDVAQGEATLADMWDYVCWGKVYRFEENKDDTINVYVSCGGLLLKITGPYKKLTPLRIDHVYLLLKK